jgi:uncharacterized protein
MARFLLFAFLLLLLYLLLRYLILDMTVRRKKTSGEPGPEELVQDPYCQTYIPKNSALKKKISGEMLYFCNHECMENYLNKTKKNPVD